MSKLSSPQRTIKSSQNKMSKMSNSLIDVPVNDTDYDFIAGDYISKEYQDKLNENSCEVEQLRDDYEPNLELHND